MHPSCLASCFRWSGLASAVRSADYLNKLNDHIFSHHYIFPFPDGTAILQDGNARINLAHETCPDLTENLWDVLEPTLRSNPNFPLIQAFGEKNTQTTKMNSHAVYTILAQVLSMLQLQQDRKKRETEREIEREKTTKQKQHLTRRQT